MFLIPDTSPVLHTPALPIEEFDDALCDIVQEMHECMALHNGLGLAAPQVGINRQILVVNFDPFVMVNPVVVSEQGSHADKEGCLSFPGLFLKVKRAQVAEVSYQDITGARYTRRFTGLQARCVLHEIDHLNGIVFTKRVPATAVLLAKQRSQK